MEIMVYFNSGNKARFDADKTTFAVINGQRNDRFAPDIDGGKIVVNWDNVSFVRQIEEREEDEEL